MKLAEQIRVVENVIEELKGENITTINVMQQSDDMEAIVIATGRSIQHVRGIANNVTIEAKRLNMPVLGTEGAEFSEWVLVDLGEVIVHVMTEKIFINYINMQKIKSIELDYKYTNLNIYLSLIKLCKIQNSKINLDKFMSKKTTVEFNNITLAHKEDGLALSKFIIKIKTNNKSYANEYSFIKELYDLRKEGVNFFRNSFDYISALDENGAIVHYKPTNINSKKFYKQSLLLLDSGAHYLEGTTDVTRVIKLNNLKDSKIKKHYTYLLKSLIKLEKKTFHSKLKGSDLDAFIRGYLSQYDIFYGHGTGHGVGYFNDVHEKYPIISPSFNEKLFHNNLFSIEPGYYVPNSYGLRIENLYFSEIKKGKLKLINVTLVPYELDLINWSSITNQEKRHIKKYHETIFTNINSRLNENEKKQFIKLFIDKL